MTKGNIQHDVLQLLDKYPVNGILDTIVMLGATDEVQKWALQYFAIKPQSGDDLDRDIIRGILHDIERLKSRIAKIELDREPRGVINHNGEKIAMTSTFPQEVVHAIAKWNPSLPLTDETLKTLMVEVDKKTKQHLKHVGGLE